MKRDQSSSLVIKTIQLIFAAFIAKGLGFVREMVLANYYGTTAIADVYVAVHNIPAIIFSVFGTAVTTGFIPLYTELSVKKGKEAADKFANNVFNIFLLLSVILSSLGILFSKQLVQLFAGGFSGETFTLCVQFAKIIMPTSIAIILVYVYNAYLQIKGMFNQSSLMNVPYNLVQIVFIAIAFYLGNAYILAVGLLVASYSQLVYLQILVRKNTDFKHSRCLDFKDSYIRQMLILVGPVFISTGVNQLNSIVDRALASRLVEGSVSALNYSGEVANIITQVVILSLTTILYPKLTALFAGSNEREKSKFTTNYINVVTILVLPLSALIFIFTKEIVQVLFGRGAFTEDTVVFVSRALKLYALGIAGASFRDVLNKVFYSMKNTFIPMVNGMIAVAFNIGLNLLLVGKYEYLGLAFATSFSATLCTLLMFIQLKKKMPTLELKLIVSEFMKATVGTAVMALAILGIRWVLFITGDFSRCIVFGGFGIAVYFVTLLVMKERVLNESLNRFKKAK